MYRPPDLQSFHLALLLAIGAGGCGDKESCESPVEILQADGVSPSGFVQCADGVIDRQEAVTCTTMLEEDSPQCLDPDNVINHGCSTSADCTSAPNGQCLKSGESCGCIYGCESDADCGEGSVCVCAGMIAYSQCRPAACETTNDCGEYACAWDSYLCDTTRSPGELACHSEADTCTVSEDCDDDDEVVSCDYDNGSSKWSCESVSYCGDGRPFVVEGSHRVAPARPRLDWGADAHPALAHLDADTRAALSAAWTRAGQDEHASVAAFSRFSLQLLSLGAPPALLVETHQAARDEIEHARLCFALASAYAGRPIGPGPLRIDDALTADEDIVGLVIVEACIGETLAACSAAAAREAADDPVVAGVLAGIAADELRHAALGWRFLAWWMQRCDALGHDKVRHQLAAALSALPRPTPSSGLQRHGRLDTSTAAQVQAAALSEVLRPTAAALLQRHARVA